jgi:hypothetical protein
MFGKEQRKCMLYANVRLFCFIFLAILITDVFGQGTTDRHEPPRSTDEMALMHSRNNGVILLCSLTSSHLDLDLFGYYCGLLRVSEGLQL